MREFTSYLRILIVLTVTYVIAELIIDDPNYKLALFNPYVIGFILFIFFIMVIFEVILGVLQRIADQLITEEKQQILEQQKQEVQENNWVNRLRKIFIGEQLASEENLFLEDHNYDGIRELDNPLPPWWRYLFYLTILFGVFYLGYYHLFDGPSQTESFQSEMALAELEIEAYKKVAVDFVDASNVSLLTDTASLEAGEKLYIANCAVCHRNDGGGGIGPNLTDKYWILGGDIKGVFQSIAKGGRPGKGMIAWDASLRPSEIQQLSSYILTMQGTQPENPKAPEGDLIQ